MIEMNLLMIEEKANILRWFYYRWRRVQMITIISDLRVQGKKWFDKSIKTMRARRNLVVLSIVIGLIIASIIGYYFVCNDEAYYKKTIAKITKVTQTNAPPIYDENGKAEPIYKQEIQAFIMNGVHKGEEIHLQNQTSFSKAYDLSFNVNDEVFVAITKDTSNSKQVSYQIIDLKRDKYVAYVTIIFVLLILFIGGFKGLRSLTSVVVNVLLFSVVIILYLKGWNLILLSIIASLLFILISISLVSGINKKTAAAVIGTMAGTLLSMIITLIVIQFTKAKGIHYEAMEFMTRPPEQIFLVEILVGTLGGIMDIAITISSSIKEMYDKNPNMEWGAIIKSGMEIGRDIMGTMANTLVFAYISGSIPMILLWMKNGFSTSEIINYNLSFEVIRALTGSIGIVISIPITLYIAALLLRKDRMEVA